MFNYASNLKSKMPDSYSSLISYLEKSAKSYPMHGCGVSLMPATSDFVDELLIEIAKAEGEAKALKIKADGEAYYNRVVAASLNEMLVRQYAIEKWDGKLPTYNGGSNIPMINLK